jgi:DNA replication protein DnaC
MAATKSVTANRDLASELVFLTRALKAPTLRDSAARLAERARAESWSHEEYLAACLQREVAARDAHGGEGRIRAARFPARKSLEEFDFDHARGLIGEVSVMRPGIGLDRGFSVVSGDGLVAEPL